MGFQEALQEICGQVSGAVAASVMGYDGIEVQTGEADTSGLGADVSISAAMVEYSNIFGQVRAAATQLQAGDASELAIRTDKMVAVGRSLNSDYFVVVALVPEGNVGKARYLLRVRAGMIA